MLPTQTRVVETVSVQFMYTLTLYALNLLHCIAEVQSFFKMEKKWIHRCEIESNILQKWKNIKFWCYFSDVYMCTRIKFVNLPWLIRMCHGSFTCAMTHQVPILPQQLVHMHTRIYAYTSNMWSAKILSVISIATKQFWWDNENEMSYRETLMEYSIIGSTRKRNWTNNRFEPLDFLKLVVWNDVYHKFLDSL